MGGGDELDHDPTALDPLDRLVTGVDTEILADLLLDRDLAPFSYTTRHGVIWHLRTYLPARVCMDAAYDVNVGRR